MQILCATRVTITQFGMFRNRANFQNHMRGFLLVQRFKLFGAKMGSGMMQPSRVVTGLSGSGPAYIFLAIEAMADGGVGVGLPRDLALKLASQTALGAAAMANNSGKHPGQLKDDVASPAGTTIAGVHELENGGFCGTLMNAVIAAANQSQELSERPQLVKGNMQLFSVDQQRSKALEAHVAAFATFKVAGNENPSTLICFASKTMNAGQIISKLHVIELDTRPGHCVFQKQQMMRVLVYLAGA